MTDDPTDPILSQALAAYRSAGKLRTPQPAQRIVRLVDQAPQPAATPPASPPATSAATGTSPASAPSIPVPSANTGGGVSLMITNAQKDSLRRLGISEDEIRDMTPAEAHRRLGLSGR